MKFFVKTAETQHKIEVERRDDQWWARVDGEEPKRAEIRAVDKDGLYSLLLDNRSYEVLVKKIDGGYRVAVGGTRFDLQLEDEKTRLLQKWMKQDEKQAGGYEVRAPMPGLIVKVNVSVGQRVKEGDSLAIIEAMKMENELRATADGTVQKILKKENDSVEKEAVLMVIG
ncbi:MAG: DUF2118 domain-containing protein [Calditrichaeota bacterium]|nr:MAG: DUF2118 domain-containing protein [Calditrichota bacterium]